MIKLFVSDLDGTLLNSNHIVAEETLQAIDALRKAKISFMPASGRDFYGIYSVLKDLKVRPKMISLNGAQFFDNDGSVLATIPIENATFLAVHDIIDTLTCVVDYNTTEGQFIHYDGDQLENFIYERFAAIYFQEDLDNVHAFIKESGMLEHIHAEDLATIKTKTILKIDLFFRDTQVKELAIQKFKAVDGIHVTSSHMYNLEITSNLASKGNMIERVCKQYGYHPDEVVVIGDSFNDISMLSKFKHSYAMAQADDKVKAVANHITGSNDELGVAKVMYQVINDNEKELIHESK